MPDAPAGKIAALVDMTRGDQAQVDGGEHLYQTRS